MLGNGFWQPLSFLLLLGGGISAWRLLSPKMQLEPPQKIIRESDAAHLIMNISMAFMVTRWYRASLGIIFMAIYGGVALFAAVCLVLEAVRPNAKTEPGHNVKLNTYLYHIVASLMMMFSVHLMQYPNEMAGMVPAFGTSMPPMAMPGEPPLLSRIVAIGFFLDALITSVVILFFPELASRVTFLLTPSVNPLNKAGPATRIASNLSNDAIRLASIPHVIMDVGMVAMLLAA